jgi:hypothetical protein
MSQRAIFLKKREETMRSNPKPHLLLRHLRFGESPRWHAGRLWVSDWGTQELIAVSPEGKREVMVTLDVPSFQPICMDWLPDGRLLIVSSADGRLLCRQADGSLTTYAQLSQVSDKGWNEIVVDGRGNTYVNGEVLALVTPDGAVRRVATHFAWPNGMAITPDNTHGKWCYLYRAIDRDGTLVDSMLSQTRNMDAAQRFFKQAISVVGHAPERVTTDGHVSYPRAIRETLGEEVIHRCNHHLNNRIEQDHRGIKQRYYPMRGFGSFTSASRECSSI